MHYTALKTRGTRDQTANIHWIIEKAKELQKNICFIDYAKAFDCVEVHVLLKPGLENFEHYFASVWDECNCAVVEHSLALPFFETGMKTDLFQSCGHCWVFQLCWHIECSTFTASCFSSAGIPSPALALLVVMLPKAYLSLQDHLPSSRWAIAPSWSSGHEDLFCTVLLCIPATSS